MVDHPGHDGAAHAGRDVDLDRASRRGVAVGVDQQVVEHLTESVPVGDGLDPSGLGDDVHLTAAVASSGAAAQQPPRLRRRRSARDAARARAPRCGRGRACRRPADRAGATASTMPVRPSRTAVDRSLRASSTVAPVRMLASGVRNSWLTFWSSSRRIRSASRSAETCCCIWARRTAVFAAAACSRYSRSSSTFASRQGARECTRLDRRAATLRRDAADRPCSGEEDDEVDHIARAGEAQGVDRRKEEIVGEHRRQRGRDERGNEPGEQAQRRDDAEIQKDVRARFGRREPVERDASATAEPRPQRRPR